MGSPRCRAPCLSGAALKRLISEWRRKMRFRGGVLSSWLHLRLWDVTVCGLVEKLWWRECAWKPFYTVCLRGNAKSSMKALQWKWKRLVYDGGKHNFILFSEETWENDEGTVLLLLLVFGLEPREHNLFIFCAKEQNKSVFSQLFLKDCASGCRQKAFCWRFLFVLFQKTKTKTVTLISTFKGLF